MRNENQQLTKLIDEIEAGIASKDKKDFPQDFTSDLYSGSDYDDLIRFDPGSLSALTIRAVKALAKRQVGESSVKTFATQLKQSDGKTRYCTAFEVINDDMAFLMNSLVAEFIERGLDIHLLLHPVYTLKRGKEGKLETYAGTQPPTIGAWIRESHIYLLVDEIDNKDLLQTILDSLAETIAQVKVSTRDWKAMSSRLSQAVSAYETNPPTMPQGEIAEAVAFLNWLLDNNFTLLGMREYSFDGKDPDSKFERVDETALGILSDPDLRVLRRGREFVVISPEMREFLRQPTALIVTKANIKSRIHRRVHLDYIGVKLFNDKGDLVGELRIVGLFTSDAYSRSVRSIPYIRRKAELVLRQAGFDPNGHSGKALMNVLDNYPRDEMFQIDADTLTHHAVAAMNIKTRPRLRILSRLDKFDRYVSIIVYVPRERYTSKQRVQIGDYLAKVYEGRVSAYYPDFPETNFARVHYIIGRYEGKTPNPSSESLENEVGDLIRTWSDGFQQALMEEREPADARIAFQKFGEAFSGAYQENYAAAAAVRDCQVIAALEEGAEVGVELYETDEQELAIKVYHLDHPRGLSERVPMLENLGFRVVNEKTYSITPKRPDGEAAEVFLHDMALAHEGEGGLSFDEIEDRVEDSYRALATGKIENDGFNALTLEARLTWQQITIVRTLARYLRQTSLHYSQGYLWDTLRDHPTIARDIVALFETKFDPAFKGSAKKRAESEAEIVQRIFAALENVASLDHDRILRSFYQVIKAAVRTNFYQASSDDREAIGIKIRSRELDFLPEPRPLFEIFVYSPRVEGVHLRFGKVARGGLRWSDRAQDFRTEVLGLVKAQQVKNAVIIPVGSKGGFVPQHLPSPSDRQAFIEEGIACYKIFIRTLISVTDNLAVDGTIIPPKGVVRHDEDDPYLVVAADKGTATFSDIANSISEDAGFWLGDAFASGGSAGYDHKVMGITARGGWEAVKRHFREVNRNIQEEPFTAVGVGDMSGDVFGNGMLLSPATRLVAAFDHRDIFIDPDPDHKKTFPERQRLFDMGRSSWQDYDTKLLSKGGGIFPRASKSIKLSKEIQAAIGLAQDSATPNEVMKAILMADVDLLWFGGIGTYIRASDESDDQAGDRANDAIRITAREVGAKVIGEGANLGTTQKARIEYAEKGGRINSDAIDNSAGVNSSDVEVNIKIALGAAIRAGKMDTKKRNKFLESMTPDVASLVLANNYLQTMSLTIAHSRGTTGYHYQKHLMRFLEDHADLNRKVEFLPDDIELAERVERGETLARPEIAVLLAYAKNELFDRILGSEITDDPYFIDTLLGYFPPALAKTYREEVLDHQLKREIIATILANAMLNHGGSSFEDRLRTTFGASIADIVSAFTIAFEALGVADRFEKVHALDNKIESAVQIEIYTLLGNQLYQLTGSLLRNRPSDKSLSKAVANYRDKLAVITNCFPTALSENERERVARSHKRWVSLGIDKAFAAELANWEVLTHTPSLVATADKAGAPIEQICTAYFGAGACFGFSEIFEKTLAVQASDYYEKIALDRALDQLEQIQQSITIKALTMTKGKENAVDAWTKANQADVERVRSSLADLFEGGRPSLARLVLAATLFKELA